MWYSLVKLNINFFMSISLCAEEIFKYWTVRWGWCERRHCGRKYCSGEMLQFCFPAWETKESYKCNKFALQSFEHLGGHSTVTTILFFELFFIELTSNLKNFHKICQIFLKTVKSLSRDVTYIHPRKEAIIKNVIIEVFHLNEHKNFILFTFYVAFSHGYRQHRFEEEKAWKTRSESKSFFLRLFWFFQMKFIKTDAKL